MKSLSSYIMAGVQTSLEWDGHFHAFSHRGVNKMSNAERRVGFADIELDCLDQYKDIPGMYDRMMPKCKGIGAWLATALKIEDIKEIYKRHPNDIVGFGELKLYDKFKGKPVNFKKISFAREVCKFSEECGNLPVYIHYELIEPQHVRAVDKLLRDFPDVPIVLCHLGMNQSNHDFAFNAAKMLASEHGNCWLDISWDAADYLSNNPLLITQLPQDRIFWGSDTSPRLVAHDFKSASPENIEDWKNAVNPYMNSDRNIRRLFAIT
ncbi:MAG: amidohydrolase [Muribaculaceae bacterium]|nr:amidohydrolase [Muribaculaceae bacterium]